jgi:hypothetical protein
MDFFVKKKGAHLASGKYKGKLYDITEVGTTIKGVKKDTTLALWKYEMKNDKHKDIDSELSPENHSSYKKTKSKKRWHLTPTNDDTSDGGGGEPVNVEIGDVRH